MLANLGGQPRGVFSRLGARPATLADWILRDRLPVRLQIQLHKLLWGDVPGR